MRLVAFLLASLTLDAAGPFLVEPYLQIGDARRLETSETLALLWHTPADSTGWVAEVKLGPLWRKMAPPASRKIAVAGIEPHLVWRATLTGLKPGSDFEYRVLHAGKPVFAAHGRARKSLTQAYRFVAFGDCAAGTDDQKAIAAQTLKLDPDFVMIPGDIVYDRGRISEYRDKFFPVYGGDQTPLLHSTLFLAAPGNHDTLNRDL